MTEHTASGTVRLQRSGVGTIIGGIVVGLLSIPFSYASAAAIVLGLGACGWLLARRYDAPTPVVMGVVAIGGIGIIEATTAYGIGLSAVVLAVVAVVFGVVDIVIGGVLERHRSGID